MGGWGGWGDKGVGDKGGEGVGECVDGNLYPRYPALLDVPLHHHTAIDDKFVYALHKSERPRENKGKTRVRGISL